MYTDLVVVLKTEKEIQEILQSVGVRQGDNMAPVLFLFLMSAAAEALEAKWRETGIAVLKVAHSRDNDLESGCVRRHTPRMYNSTRLIEIFQLLYVDNSAFPFPDRNALTAGINLIHSHFAQFGLEIHIGEG
jgi:ribosome-binding ATPase YchF (GTP1/OBG family)